MMEVGSIINILRNHPEGAVLKPGDLLDVRVVDVFEGRRALVDLGRFRALADITFPVAPGDELRVRVQQTEGPLRLQLLPASNRAAPEAGRASRPAAALTAALRTVQVRIDQLANAMQRLPDAHHLPAEVRQVVDALKFFWKPLDPGLRSEALAGKLREFCEDSGLLLEQRLSAAAQKTGGGTGGRPAAERGSSAALERILATDLKSRLLFIKGFFESAVGRQLIHDHREAAGLASTAVELLADIRAGQEQLARTAGGAHPFQMVHYVVPMAGERCRAELKIAYGRRPAAGKDEGHRAAILLELDRMGAVRADLTLKKNRLNVAVFVSSSGMKDLVNRHAPEMHETLAPFFEQVTVQVSVSSRKIAGFVSEDWRPTGETQVDVRV